MHDKTILVVDDEPHIRYMLEFKLGGAGYRVVTASSGPAALERARAETPDLVITDFQMPGGGGLELSKALKREPGTADVPVVMLTGRSHKIPKAELAATNICQLIAKPFSPRELTATVDELLGLAAASTTEAGTG
ncbi:MAG: response regulator [Planctomycetota bacterium]|jgi:two-component system phosphate regulon response regulator PhoB